MSTDRRIRHPGALIVVAFAVVIAAGTLLLALPISHRGGQSVNGWHAFFTAASAVTVTGLAVVDTGAEIGVTHLGEVTEFIRDLVRFIALSEVVLAVLLTGRFLVGGDGVSARSTSVPSTPCPRSTTPGSRCSPTACRATSAIGTSTW